jgi:4-amino-4-deoxy-L-arabinose transferase-like glycosyltransferase
LYRATLIAITLVYLCLGITYALATPPLEASDEFKHYPYVQYVQTEQALPILDLQEPGLWLQDGGQPPLYYLVMAALTAGIDTGDLPEVHQLNAHAFIGNSNQVTNKNLILHRPEREQFPWHGSILAIYLIRLASVGLGVGTIWLAGRLGTRLFDPLTGLFAAALTAFNPMFLFVHAAVNNDSLAAFLGALALYLLVVLWQTQPDPRTAWPTYAALGLVLGLGMLTKLSLTAFLALTGVALAWLAWRSGRWTFFFIGGPITAGLALLIAGWWFLRNLQLYGDLTGLDRFIAIQGARPMPLTWLGWWQEFGTFYRTYWGLFGAVNIAAPQLFYLAANVMFLAGVAGLIRRRQQGLPAGFWLPVVWAAVLFLLLLRWTAIYFSFQGRLMFPALAGVNALWAAGLLAWLRPVWRPKVAGVIGSLFLIVAALLPWTAIRPAYAYPEPVATVPEAARFGPITFTAGEDRLQLVGVEMAPGQSVLPAGEPVEVVLYWQAVAPVNRNYLTAVHLLGRGAVSVGQVNRHPAGGMIPTGQWQPGQIWRDVYHVWVQANAEAPARLQVTAALFDPETRQNLPATGPDGQLLPLLVVGAARLAAAESASAPPPVSLEVPFSEGITLQGYDLDPQPASAGESLVVTLYWQATAIPSAAYTVFVHLLGPDGNQQANGDGPPLNGDYPTSFWRPGDEVVDSHLLTIPAGATAGTYQIAVGLYDPATGRRLARLDGAGDTVTWPATIR